MESICKHNYLPLTFSCLLHITTRDYVTLQFIVNVARSLSQTSCVGYNKKNMSSWKGRNQIFQMWCIQSMLLKTERGRLLVDMDLSVRAEGCDALQKLRRLAGSRAILHLRFRT